MRRRTLTLTSAVFALTLIAGACSPPADDKDTGNPPVIDTSTDGEGDDADAGMDTSDGTDDEMDADTTTFDDEDGDSGGMDDPDGDTGTDADDGGMDADTMETDTRDCTIDSDSDGLTDCEEENLCTDPNDGDTDGDYLSDLEELQEYGSDPCKKDSDNDGAPDNVEVDHDLDPNRVSTYGDGVQDGNRWILTACEDPEAEPVIFFKNRTGNWTLALPTAFKNTYQELTPTISNPSPVLASSVYDDTTNEVSGFLLSKEAPSGQTSPLNPLRGTVDNNIRSLASVNFDLLGSTFTTHDDKTAATVNYEISTTQAKSVRRLREELLLGLAPFNKNNVQGLPATAGKQYNKFRVQVTVSQRNHTTGVTSNLYSVALAPLDNYKTVDKVKFRVQDLTNTTNISDAVDDHKVSCLTKKPNKETPKAEFYWVLDQSGSMRAENNIIRSFATQFESEVKNTRLDYRLGVTNMDPQNKGVLVTPPAWHRNAQTFSQEIKDRVTDCQTTGGYGCSGGTEHGLYAAHQGLLYMLGLTAQTPTPAERIRSNAQVITIWMSDEAAQGMNSQVEAFYKNDPNLYGYAITAHNTNSNCTTGFPEPAGKYRDVALASGGGFADLCSGDLRQTIQAIIRQAAFASGEFVLGQTPISSSLRVYLISDDGKSGEWVPRNRDDGFDYAPQRNAVAFFGKYRPEYKMNGQPDWVAISFETFRNRCKNLGPDVDTCAAPANP